MTFTPELLVKTAEQSVSGMTLAALGITSSLLTDVGVKTADYTTSGGELIRMDASGGAHTVTLPTAPSNGTRVTVKKVDSSTNGVIVARGGTDVFNIAGGNPSITLTPQFSAITAQYSSGVWVVTSVDPGAGVLYSGLAAIATADVADNAITSAKLAAAVRASILSGTTAWAATTVVTAGQVMQLPTGGLGWRTAAGTTRSSFDATERALWTFLPGGHYELVTTAAGAFSWICPAGITQVRGRLRGSGGGGAGGGAAALTGGTATQVGGAGGGSGVESDFTAAVTATSTYSGTIGTAGTGGTGGAASSGATGNAGTGGSVPGADSTLTIGGTTYTAASGNQGNAGGANSATTVNAGTYGGRPTSAKTAAQFIPGCGGPAFSTGGSATTPLGGVIGGSGGGQGTASFGGAGGNARTTVNGAVVAQASQTGSTTGGAGTTATQPGCGGAGGGAGAPGGAGGNGGAGAPGSFEAWF